MGDDAYVDSIITLGSPDLIKRFPITIQIRLDFIGMRLQICNGRTKRNSHLHIATMKEGLVNVIKYPLFQPKRRL